MWIYFCHIVDHQVCRCDRSVKLNGCLRGCRFHHRIRRNPDTTVQTSFLSCEILSCRICFYNCTILAEPSINCRRNRSGMGVRRRSAKFPSSPLSRIIRRTQIRPGRMSSLQMARTNTVPRSPNFILLASALSMKSFCRHYGFRICSPPSPRNFGKKKILIKKKVQTHNK